MTDTMVQGGAAYTKLDAATTATEFGTVMLSLIVRLEAALADVEADKLKLASVIERVRQQTEAMAKLRKEIGTIASEANVSTEAWIDAGKEAKLLWGAIPLGMEDRLDALEKKSRTRKRPVKK